MSSKERWDIVGVIVYALVIFAFAILCGVLLRQRQYLLSGMCGYIGVKESRGFWKMLNMKDGKQ